MKRFADVGFVLGSSVLLAAMFLTGCASTKPTVARDLTVMNNPDNFSLHIGSVQNFSYKTTYSWENSGTKASVRQASSIAEGVANLEVRDAAGLVVHAKSLRESGSFTTFEGKPGTWKIHFVLNDATGSVTFEVRRSG